MVEKVYSELPDDQKVYGPSSSVLYIGVDVSHGEEDHVISDHQQNELVEDLFHVEELLLKRLSYKEIGNDYGLDDKKTLSLENALVHEHYHSRNKQSSKHEYQKVRLSRFQALSETLDRISFLGYVDSEP